jgi:hypothetical protein
LPSRARPRKNLDLIAAFKGLRGQLPDGMERLFRPYLMLVIEKIKEAIAEDDTFDPFDFAKLEYMQTLPDDVSAPTFAHLLCCYLSISL